MHLIDVVSSTMASLYEFHIVSLQFFFFGR